MSIFWVFFHTSMNLFSSKQRHNNLILIITQSSNLSKHTNKVEFSLALSFPPRPQKHRNMIQNKVNLFSPCFFSFFQRIPSHDGKNSTVFIIDSKFYLGERCLQFVKQNKSSIMIRHLDRKSTGNHELVAYFCKLHIILDKS